MLSKKNNDSGIVMWSELEKKRRRREAIEIILLLLLLLFSCAGGISVGNTVYDLLKYWGLDVSRQNVKLACYTVSFLTLFAAAKNFEFFTDEWKREADYWKDRCSRLEEEINDLHKM